MNISKSTDRVEISHNFKVILRNRRNQLETLYSWSNSNSPVWAVNPPVWTPKGSNPWMVGPRISPLAAPQRGSNHGWLLLQILNYEMMRTSCHTCWTAFMYLFMLHILRKWERFHSNWQPRNSSAKVSPARSHNILVLVIYFHIFRAWYEEKVFELLRSL